MTEKSTDKTPAALPGEDEIEQCIAQLQSLIGEMTVLERSFSSLTDAVSPTYRLSARNLLHYMAVRQHDVRELQDTLSSYGLSSLGRAEPHMMANVKAVLRALHSMSDCQPDATGPEAPVGFRDGRRLLDEHTSALLGPVSVNRNTRIMVTMPAEAATDYELVRDLLDGGMDCVRINCAYDDATAWGRMIANLRKAEHRIGKRCKVFMDLAGHKLRTGPIEPADPIVRWSSKKDAHGKTVGISVIWLVPDSSIAAPPVQADATLSVPGEWLKDVLAGDGIEFVDARGKPRRVEVIAAVGENRIGECGKSAYLTPDIDLQHVPAEPGRAGESARIVKVPASEKFILMNKGDTLIVTGDGLPGRPPVYDSAGRLLRPATISVTLPEVIARVSPGERIWIDDGKIGGVIRTVNHDHFAVEITHARPRGGKLRSGKGINLPDTVLELPPLTEKDLADLAFVAKNADAVCFSFVSRAQHVHELQARLKALGGEELGVVLKIETLEAFEHLPELLLAAMRSPTAGVMIARGDLAVECGYERMAEVQEEILWFCEAAHMPVIWATQVLEKLAKKGLPSRAEITDAAMGVRAECVMLNKGPYILDAVRTLDDILERMQDHQRKKNSMLRQLKLARNLQA